MEENTSIVIFGEALVDLFKNAAVVGGAPFNVARHLAGFGLLKPIFISAIGTDNAADLITQEIKRYELAQDGIQIHRELRTGFVQVHENDLGHEFEIMPNCAYDYIELNPALTYLKQLKKNKIQNILYHGTLGLRSEMSFNTFQGIRNELILNSKTKTYLDINWRNGQIPQDIAKKSLIEADIIKASLEELQMITGWFEIYDHFPNQLPELNSINDAIKKLFNFINAEVICVTYGNLGSAVFNQDAYCIASAPSFNPKLLVDTVGAGDAFSSVILLALNQGWAWDVALHRANKFAAAVCGIRGATPEQLSFYQPFQTAWEH